uniref:Uncharacterized protein n=1 Tax=viral metagenome TaxID=1070528 RepID=A0A6C0IE03_9ZZZZ
MYNTKILCTYHTSDVFLNSDELSESDMDFIRDSIYRQELLYILNIEEFNEYEMNIALHELYEKIKGSTELIECMRNLASHFTSIDEEFGLMLLFAFDYMYLTHICICEFLETGKISELNITNLKKIAF